MTRKLHIYTAEEVRALRAKAGMNQTEFWGAFGVTQSGGCRYEAGRGISMPLQMLLNIAFGGPATSAGIVSAVRVLRGD